MITAPAGVSLGGAAVGTIILFLVLQRWWLKGSKGKSDGDGGGGRSWKTLLPFGLGSLYGMLAILAAGGLLGTIVGIALWGANGLGDLALIYGVGGNSPMASRGQQLALTDGGHVIVLLTTALVIGAWRWSKKFPRKQVGLGVLCGICLGLNAGIAGIMAIPLANFANVAGSWWTGVVA
ncbi:MULTISPECIES: hypothetical protein [Streptomyces]|uniref:hypothetical protein n=1 Tax=Streptomyces TaxID=1883 RepID=UPI000743FE1F|nr:hypothetical protein [Streptomyces albidoflavus]KUL59661.1 hypothetical protein ADL32_19015 [Streptomyces albidoflavus]WST10787.1 hypothetical protein OG525_23805 [Streptomyces albidoflavus]